MSTLLERICTLIDERRLADRPTVAVVLTSEQRSIVTTEQWMPRCAGLTTRADVGMRVTHIRDVPVLEAEALEHVADVLGLHVTEDGWRRIEWRYDGLTKPVLPTRHTTIPSGD